MADLWDLILGIVRGLAIVVGALWVGGFLRGLAHAWLEWRLDPTWRGILSQFVRFLPLVLVMQTVLEGVGIPSTSYIAALSTAGLAIALSLRDSLSNAASGAILLTTTPFRVGDVVTISGVNGTVRRVGFLTTEVETDDARLVTLTNDRVLSSNIERHGLEERMRVEMPLRLPAAVVDEALLARLREAAGPGGLVTVTEIDTIAGARVLVKRWCPPGEAAAAREALAVAVARVARATGEGS